MPVVLEIWCKWTVSLLSHDFKTMLKKSICIWDSQSYFERSVLKQDKSHFHTKWVIKEDIFAACTDYRGGAADAENLWLTPEDWNSLNSYDSLWIHTHKHTLTHTQPTTCFLCINGSHGGSSSSSSSSVVPAPILLPTPHLQTSSQSACSPLNAPSSSPPHRQGQTRAPTQPTVQNHSDTDYQRMFCPANRNGFDSASGLLWSYEVFDCVLSVTMGSPWLDRPAK